MIAFRQSTYEKENFIKIMLAVIIFMLLVYRESLKESCLSYEKLVNEFEKICNSLENGLFLEISYKKIIKFLDTFYK